MQYTVDLAKSITELSYADFSPQVINAAKDCIIDSLGCAIYGSRNVWSSIITEFVKEQGGEPQSTLWFNNLKGPATTIPLATGVMVRALNYDDTHHAKVHPGSVVLPAADTINSVADVVTSPVSISMSGYGVMSDSATRVEPTNVLVLDDHTSLIDLTLFHIFPNRCFH